MNDPLAKHLEALDGPPMPEAAEARILGRLHAEVAKPNPKPFRRILASAKARQLALLFALTLIAGWVFRREVAPILREAWERTHCWVDPSARNP